MKKMYSLLEGRVQHAFSLTALKRCSSAAALIVLFAAMSVGSARAVTINVTAPPYNASTNGTTNDTTAINNAITACNAAGGGIVEFPSGKYLTGSVHLKSNVTLQLDSGSTILGASSGYDAAESLGCTNGSFDFGHSHFHDALIWGENLTNIGFTGSGTINGNGHLSTSNAPDKAISLKLCDGVIITGITIMNGGHFGILTNGTNNMMIDNVKIHEANQRDGFNLISAKHVYITNSDIEGSDDSMCLKSDFALCQVTSSEDIHVDNCTILSTGNNAIQFGSETVGNFTDCTFSHCKITKAGKAGLGVTANDGSVIDGVTFSDITITGCVTPIFLKIDHQNRESAVKTTSKIRNISFINITGSGNGSTTSTVEGCGTVSPAVTIDNIVFNNVNLTVPGGGSASEANNVPPTDNNWQPRYIGTAPSYGFFLRHVTNVTFLNCQTHYSSTDNRPAIKCDNDGADIKIDSSVFEHGSGALYDLGFFNVNGYQVTNSGSPVVSAPSPSVAASIAFPPIFNPYTGTFASGQSVAFPSATSGATIRYTTDDSTPTATSGILYSGPITLTADTPIRAIASASGLRDSAVNTAIYTITGGGPPPAAAPVFSPGGGSFTSAQSVSMSSATSGATIRYTTDGSTPSETNGTTYNPITPVSIGSTTTLEAIAIAAGFADSNVTIETYTIVPPNQAAAPVFTPPGGTYTSAQSVSISSATSGASIRYTTDGSTPTETNGTIYSGLVGIGNISSPSTTVLKAIAYGAGLTDSMVTSETYTITEGSFGGTIPLNTMNPVGTGATVSTAVDANTADGLLEFLNSTAIGQFMTLTTPSLPAGTYQVQFRYKTNTSRAQHNVVIDGTQIGGTIDQYSTSQTYPTVTLGTVTFATTGTHTIVLNVTGKDSAATHFYICGDAFTFIAE